MRLTAKRWKNGGKSRAQGPGAFQSTKIIFNVVKTLLITVKLVSSPHMDLTNCSRGFNGASGTVALEKRWKMGYSLTT